MSKEPIKPIEQTYLDGYNQPIKIGDTVRLLNSADTYFYTITALYTVYDETLATISRLTANGTNLQTVRTYRLIQQITRNGLHND